MSALSPGIGIHTAALEQSYSCFSFTAIVVMSAERRYAENLFPQGIFRIKLSKTCGNKSTCSSCHYKSPNVGKYLDLYCFFLATYICLFIYVQIVNRKTSSIRLQ